MTDALGDALRELVRAEVRAQLAAQRATPAPPRLLSVAEAADALSISRAGLYKLLTAGAIASHSIGRRRLISESSLRTYIDGERP